MSRPSKRKDFDVYDFNEEEEIVEKSQTLRFVKRRAKPGDDDSLVDKIEFLKAFAPIKNFTEKVGTDVMCEDDKRNGEHEVHVHDPSTLSPPDVKVVDATDTSDEGSPASSGSKQSDGPLGEAEGDISPESSKEDLPSKKAARAIAFSSCRNETDWRLLEPPFNLEQQVLSPGDEDTWSTSSSCHTNPSRNDSKDQVSTADSQSISKGAEEANARVIVSPDYVVYELKSYVDCQLIFSQDCIRIESLDALGDDDLFNFEWSLENLIHIDRLWSQSVETVWVEVQAKPTAGIGNNGMHEVSGSLSLIFTVFGREWLCHEQKILSLSPGYKDVWKVKTITRNAIFPDSFAGINTVFASCYLTDFEGISEDVVYPEGDPDAVSISRRDIELLQPETFINDTIIDFYIKYLRRKLEPEENNRFHFFNSFFFRKLVDMDKEPQSRLEGRAAFLRVRKWTRKVNIFERDYLFIPVNFNLHWSLLIVCHPGEIANFVEKNRANALKLPCILHLDSLRGSHCGLKHLMQSYLWEEWKERYPVSPSDASHNFLNLRFISLELPQQENMFDCGLFLLHYVELFLKQAPVNFSPFSITNLSNFLDTEWFVPAEASFKRYLIRNLLYDLLCCASRQNGAFSCSDKDHLSEFPTNNLVKGRSSELLPNQCRTYSSEIGDADKLVSDKGIELELCTRSSADDELVERQFFVSERTAGSCHDRQKHYFQGVTSLRKQRCALSPIEEGAEQDACTDSGKEILQPFDSDTASTLYPCLGFCEVDVSHALTNSLLLKKNEDGDILSETSRTDSQILIKGSSSETGVNACNDVPHNGDLTSIMNEEDGLRYHSLGSSDYSKENTTISSSEDMLNRTIVDDTRESNACLLNLNKENNIMPILQEKLGTADESLGVSLPEGVPDACIIEDSQGDDDREGTEKTESVSAGEKVDARGNLGSHILPGSVLENYTIKDSQVDANRDILNLKQEPDSLEKFEEVSEGSRSSTLLETETCIARDSQRVVKSENEDCVDSLQSFRKDNVELPCQEVVPNPSQDVSLDGEVQTNSNDLGDVPGLQSHKRRKVQHTERGRIRTRSVSRNTSC